MVIGATAIIYAFAPVALAALHRVDGGRPRSYRMPMPRVLLPAGFCSANLIIYLITITDDPEEAAAVIIAACSRSTSCRSHRLHQQRIALSAPSPGACTAEHALLTRADPSWTELTAFERRLVIAQRQAAQHYLAKVCADAKKLHAGR